MITGKTMALTRRTFVDKVLSLLFNILLKLIIAFLPRGKCFFNVMVAITICNDFGTKKIKSTNVQTVSPSICHEVMGTDAMILVF